MSNKATSRKAAEEGLPTRRRLADGTQLVIRSALTYIPRRRGARHYADSFSRALLVAKDGGGAGEQWAHDVAPALAAIVPAATDLLVCPPASREKSARWYLARELTCAVGRLLGLPVGRPLRWAHKTEAAKSIRHQGGHGRKKGFFAECFDDLAGLRVCCIDDLVTTGLTMTATVEALAEAGAEEVFARTLARTERTEDRPARERRLVAVRGQVRELKRRARAAARGSRDGQ